MFDSKDLSALDPKYFSIIFTDAFDVTIMSRNTGHYWFIHDPEYPTPGTCIIFHKHKASHISRNIYTAKGLLSPVFGFSVVPEHTPFWL